MSKKEAYEKKLQAQLDELSADIDKLKARAAQAEADSQLEYQKQLEDLREKRAAAQDKLENIKGSSEEAWEDIKAGADGALESLSAALKSASARFK
ncbi:hypothetical protein [Pseudomonas benzenivorans]|uniref:Coiled coil domain-containing protein n=1 Tax=Pseudomonas benzenivorans TaxID=556533 RepID=A0ABY5H8D3_9PSED|nr:hypothetical protein [Pseudomonas benzenivorans]UTW08279.1 hypothetical protein KDW96_02830 [Pseudomonas benzenivorans]